MARGIRKGHFYSRVSLAHCPCCKRFHTCTHKSRTTWTRWVIKKQTENYKGDIMGWTGEAQSRRGRYDQDTYLCVKIPESTYNVVYLNAPLNFRTVALQTFWKFASKEDFHIKFNVVNHIYFLLISFLVFFIISGSVTGKWRNIWYLCHLLFLHQPENNTPMFL